MKHKDSLRCNFFWFGRYHGFGYDLTSWIIVEEWKFQTLKINHSDVLIKYLDSIICMNCTRNAIFYIIDRFWFKNLREHTAQGYWIQGLTFSLNFSSFIKVALNSLGLQLFFAATAAFTSQCASRSKLCFICAVVVSLPALGEYFMTFFWLLSFSLRCLWWLHTHHSSWILYWGVFHKTWPIGRPLFVCHRRTVFFFLTFAIAFLLDYQRALLNTTKNSEYSCINANLL